MTPWRNRMTLRLSEEEYAELMRRRTGGRSMSAPTPGNACWGDDSSPAKRQKYGNQRVEIDGKKFDSKHEAEVYGELMLRRRAGELRVIMRQVPFDLPGGIRYVADFAIIDKDGRFEVLDAKSEATRKNRTYINKRKQMLSEWGIEIREV